MTDNQKRIYSTKGHHSVKTEYRVIVLFLYTSSDGAVYLYKISRIHVHLKLLSRCGTQIYILDGFQDVEHKSTSLMVLKND